MRGITLKSASIIIQQSISIARNLKLPPLAVVVLDSGGHVKVSSSEDGTGTLRHEIAVGKASAALGIGFGTRKFHHMVEKGELPEMFANSINGASKGKFIPLPGGVLILENKDIIGAVGISGANSDQDEAVAIGAIQYAGFEYSS